MQETDQSAPYAKGVFEYYTRTVEGLGYVIHCRQPRGGGEETILVDENQVAKDNTGSDFTSVGDVSVSPSAELLALKWQSSDRVHQMRVE